MLGYAELLDPPGVSDSLRDLEIQLRKGVGKVTNPLGIRCGFIFLGNGGQLGKGQPRVLPLLGDVVQFDVELLLPRLRQFTIELGDFSTNVLNIVLSLSEAVVLLFSLIENTLNL